MLSDDDRVDISDALRWQRDYVLGSGSPTAALIVDAALDDLRHGGALGSLLPERVRFGDLPGLRVMAAVHRLALDRQAPAVALRLPTLGGTPPATDAERTAFRRDVVAVLAEHPDVVADSLRRTPQTNEPGRAALLRCALSREPTGRPVLLHEIGASAGLNLRADHLPGRPGLEAGPLPPISLRRGYDLEPVDITRPDGRALLGSYVWVDDVERFRRLARAMDVAARVPAELVRADAADAVAGLHLVEGATTVLWHSAMWIYLPEATRATVEDGLSRLGGRATPAAPLVHVAWEWEAAQLQESGFVLTVTRWSGQHDDGVPTILARGRSHGDDVLLVSG